MGTALSITAVIGKHNDIILVSTGDYSRFARRQHGSPALIIYTYTARPSCSVRSGRISDPE